MRWKLGREVAEGKPHEGEPAALPLAACFATHPANDRAVGRVTFAAGRRVRVVRCAMMRFVGRPNASRLQGIEALRGVTAVQGIVPGTGCGGFARKQNSTTEKAEAHGATRGAVDALRALPEQRLRETSDRLASPRGPPWSSDFSVVESCLLVDRSDRLRTYRSIDDRKLIRTKMCEPHLGRVRRGP